MRTIEVTSESKKLFRIVVPDDAKLTFGPWSPPSGKERAYGETSKALNGTLRVYENHTASASVLAVFSGVTGYRDLSIEMIEQVAVETGSVIWNSDRTGYSRSESVKRDESWTTPAIAAGVVVAPVEKRRPGRPRVVKA